MKLKTNLKCRLLSAILCIAAFVGGFAFAPHATITAQAQTGTTAQPCADIKEWTYKIEDGKLYKRIYNVTKNRWEGEWIYVCEWPYDVP